jgi:hypothetical protein
MLAEPLREVKRVALTLKYLPKIGLAWFWDRRTGQAEEFVADSAERRAGQNAVSGPGALPVERTRVREQPWADGALPPIRAEPADGAAPASAMAGRRSRRAGAMVPRRHQPRLRAEVIELIRHARQEPAYGASRSRL